MNNEDLSRVLTNLETHIIELRDRIQYLERENALLHEDLKDRNEQIVTEVFKHLKNHEDFISLEATRYIKDVCVGLSKAFKEHFENDEFSIPEKEFDNIILSAQGLPF